MDMPYVVGVDVGGQTTKIGVVDMRGQVLAQTVIRTDTYDEVDPYIEELAEAITKVVADAGVTGQVRGIGMGIPNGNYYTGEIENAVNLKWGNKGVVPVAKLLKDKMNGVPVALTNDANAAAMGEMTYGAARGMKNFIMITLGTGVGAGIVINGQMVYGSDGMAGELGHVIMRRENGRTCGCGRKGCLEAYCSATGVARTAREFLETSNEPSLLRDMNPEEITSLDVSKAATKGDALALRVYEFTGKMLGEACADFMTFCSPEAFVFFGGLTKAGDLLMKPLIKGYEENVMGIFRGKAKFLVSSLDGAGAAVLGASAIAKNIEH